MPPLTQQGLPDQPHGTWFTIEAPTGNSPRQAFERLEVELEKSRPEFYLLVRYNNRSELIFKQTVMKSPNQLVSRGRVLQTHSSDLADRLLVTIKLQNAFWTGDGPQTTWVRESELDNLVHDRKWIKKVADIPLVEHIQAFQTVVKDLSALGYRVGRVDEQPCDITLPKIHNGAGELPYSPNLIPKIIDQKWLKAPTVVEVGIASRSSALASALAKNLQLATAKITNGQCRMVCKTIRPGETHPLNIFTIPSTLDLAVSPAWRNRMIKHESSGLRFNLVNEGTFENARPFAYRNLCLDLLIQGGAQPWIPMSLPGLSVGMDAGHSHTENRSRWISTLIHKDNALNPVINIEETERAEHIPADTLSRWWPSFAGRDVLVIRDGKVASEFEQIKRYASASGQTVVEIPKRPCIVLFRGPVDQPRPAMYGDALVHPRSGVLIQSNAMKEPEYGPPIWVRSVLGNIALKEAAQSILNLTAIPGQLYNPPRLPAPLYWADAVSKLTSKDWTSVIGRGFRVQSIIPT